MMSLLCTILVLVFLPPAGAVRSSELFATTKVDPEISAWNQVIVPKLSELVEWKENLSAVGPLEVPIGHNEASIIDISMRMALLAYGRRTDPDATSRIHALKAKGEEQVTVLEVTVRGVQERDPEEHYMEEDDCPYGVIYLLRLAEGEVGIILSFQGSTNRLDWLRNLNFRPSHLVKADSDVKVHRGFGLHVESVFEAMGRLPTTSYTLAHIWKDWKIPGYSTDLADFVNRGRWKWCICVGHSLGGAMAAIAAECIAVAVDRPREVYAVSIGAPVPGNKAFVADMKEKVLPQGGLRVENPYDLVPWTGYAGLKFISRHVNGIVWTLPKDQWMRRTDKLGAHTKFNVVEHDGNGEAHHRLYNFGSFETSTDPEATAYKNYGEEEWSKDFD